MEQLGARGTLVRVYLKSREEPVEYRHPRPMEAVTVGSHCVQVLASGGRDLYPAGSVERVYVSHPNVEEL